MTSLGASIVVPEAVETVESILTEFVEINDLHRKASAGNRAGDRRRGRLHHRFMLRRHHHSRRRLHDRSRSRTDRAASGHDRA